MVLARYMYGWPCL